VPSTPIPLVPLATVTPRPDGSIFHVVGYGQTLWAIALAYGIKIDQIRAWNNLAAGSTSIYAGERLLVHLAGSVTPTPVAPVITSSATLSMTSSSATPSATLSDLTATLLPATMTGTVILPPATMTVNAIATARPTLSPTFIPTVQPAGSTGIDARRIIGIVLVVVCAVGLLALLLPHFWDKK
jgi:murein DD-endopeptidase MepM/ murein hydrolase activator NlpD